jgi:hypothetical protein
MTPSDPTISPAPELRLLSSKLQRVAVIALTLIPFLVVTTSTVPALIVLPFLPNGVERVRILMAQFILWTRTILGGS